MPFDRPSYPERFFVLRRQPLGENDEIIVGLGRESGRFSAVVRGSRKPRSRLAGLLEPPVELEGQLREGRNLDGLSQIQLRRAFAGLRQSLTGLLTAGFFSRLFQEALPERASNPEIYELFSLLHERLAEGSAVAPLALWGQDRLLAELGLAPQLDGCLSCGSTAVAGFSALEGGMLCAACYSGSGFAVSRSALNGLRQLREMKPENTLPHLEAGPVREMGRILKTQLQQHLGVSDRVFRRVLPKDRT